MKRIVVAAILTLPCLGQIRTLKVYSEFTRIDPFGNIVNQDKGSAEPRHILSPGVPRNAFSSLRIVVTLDKPTKYILDIGQNPENAVKASLYKERFVKHGEQWIPDGLEPVKIPYEATFPEVGGAAQEIPGQTSVTFWLDMWVDRKADVDRIKVEPQVWVGYADDWYTYPMEVRILSAVIPDMAASTASAPEVQRRSDAAAIGPMRAAYCASPEKPGPAATTARSLIRRNALQYLALPGPTVTAKLLSVTKSTSLKSWCADTSPSSIGPEWFLRFRDSVIQTPQ